MIENFIKSINNLISEFEEKLKTIRSYKFALHWLENIEINCYGGKYQLKSLSNISQLDLLKYKIEPWDQNTINDIERDIKKTNFGGSIVKEKSYLIVSFPPITEETKRNLLKNLSQIKEEYRIKVRILRDEFLKDLKNKKENKMISEDLFFKNKEKVDKEVESFNKKLEQLFQAKEKEILG
jgi:ribosome recycling factor